MKNLNVAIIGAGKVGTAFALDFSRKKIKVVAVIDKDVKKAKKLAQILKSDVASKNISDIPSPVNLFVITVQDRFISKVAEELANTFESFQNKYAFHTSGALSSDELKALETKGCYVFSLHPNFSFASDDFGSQRIIKFTQSVFAIESKSRKAISFAKNFCKAFDYEFIEIKPEQKTLYHIFSVMISNYNVTKFYQIEKNLGKKFIKSYLNLLKSTIQNIETYGVKRALTGPIVRKDFQTIQKHIKELSLLDKDLKNIYKKFGHLTISIIEKELNKSSIKKLKRLFD